MLAKLSSFSEHFRTRRLMASSNIFYLFLLIAVVTAASPMAYVLDFSSCFSTETFYKSFFPRVLSIWSTVVQHLNPVLAIFAAVIGYLLTRLYSILFMPIEVVRTLEDVGYAQKADGGLSKKDLANTMRRLRKSGEVPPVYPNGWFSIIDSDQLKVGEVKYVCILGEHLAVFRGEDGSVSVLDAYCPHLGANLGVGGQVVGNCIKCPFHGWVFRGDDGKCVDIPYTEKVPDVAKIKSWPSVEKNGSIYIWYHAEGIDPTWEIEDIEEIQNGTWCYRGRTEHMINAHCEEIPENGADVSHLNYLHSSPIFAGSDLRSSFSKFWKFAQHNWDASWQPNEGDEKHTAELTLRQEAYLLGYKIPFTDFYVTAKQIGPGIVYLRFKSCLGSGCWVHHVTPTEPLLQKMTHRIYAASTIPTFVSSILLYGEALQVERDIMVWNNKTFQKKPLLVKEDYLISKHRRWYSQFYSEHSPRLTLRKETSVDW